jgi:hypothetical protein
MAWTNQGAQRERDNRAADDARRARQAAEKALALAKKGKK